MSKRRSFYVYQQNGDGRNNLCGLKIRQLRLQKHWSQRQLAEKLQLLGIDLDKNAIQRMEAGLRFVTDIELFALAKTFETTSDALLEK